MKFDVIVGNPPYNGARTADGQTNTIWHLFVIKSLELLKENGYLITVHPPVWRKPDSNMWKMITNYNITHLYMFNIIDGKRYFGVSTKFDYYILNKNLNKKSTLVKTHDNNILTIDLTKWNWLPSSNLELFKKIISNTNDVCEIEFTYNYNYRCEWMSTKQTSIYKHPVLRNYKLNSKPEFIYSSRRDFGGFGIPKVMFTTNGTIQPIKDYTGKYATSSHAMAIKCNSKKEVDLIYNALRSKKFQSIIKYFTWSNYEIEWKAFQSLKKDFWKYFVDEKGNEI